MLPRLDQQKRESADEILVLWFANPEKARRIEERLKTELKPIYNDSSPFLTPDELFAALELLVGLMKSKEALNSRRGSK